MIGVDEMPRMNIHVPPELKTRMNAKHGVNWSRAACQAFEAQLVTSDDLQAVDAHITAATLRTIIEDMSRSLFAAAQQIK